MLTCDSGVDGGEMVVMDNKMLKVGMRGHMGCGGLSRSRRLSVSSRL